MQSSGRCTTKINASQWKRLAHIDPMEVTLSARAMSLLIGMDFQDNDAHPPILPKAQALDVIRYFTGECREA